MVTGLFLLFVCPFWIWLFFIDAYMKPSTKLLKIKQYLIFNKSFLKRNFPKQLNQLLIKVYLYIMILVNWWCSLLLLQIWFDGGSETVGDLALYLLILALINLVLRMVFEVILITIPNYRFKKECELGLYGFAQDKYEHIAYVNSNGNYCFCAECGMKYLESDTQCPNCGFVKENIEDGK